MADEADVHSIGDRLERAIERHADTAGEIHRGEREKPRSLRRNVLWLLITLVSLYLVFPSLVDTFSSWRQITRFSATVADRHVRLAGGRVRVPVGPATGRAARSPVAAGDRRAARVQRPVEHRAGRRTGRRRACSTGSSSPPAWRAATVVSALTAVNLLVFAVVLGLPILAIPACCAAR